MKWGETSGRRGAIHCALGCESAPQVGAMNCSPTAIWHTFRKLLAFCVLRRFTGTLQTGLLALLHTRITREVASFAQGKLPFRVYAHEGTSNCVTNSARLSAGTTTNNANRDGICVAQIKQTQGGVHCGKRGFTSAKIGLGTFPVDGNTAITVGVQAHAGYSRLAASHTVVILTFDGICQGRFSSFLFT